MFKIPGGYLKQMNELLKVLEDMKKSEPERGAKQSTLDKTDFSRVQSPSSTNTYFECPRRYFYKYIKDIPTLPSIYLIRGKMVHAVLEDFFELDPSKLSPEGFVMEMKMIMMKDFQEKWLKDRQNIIDLGMGKDERLGFFQSSKVMILKFAEVFADKVKHLLPKMQFVEAFNAAKPKTELYFKSEEYKVQGYVDAIFDSDKVKIIDYKTSSRDIMREGYKRQLAIYALMYEEKYGKLPDEVGIHFLLFGETILPATMEMVEDAKKDLAYVHSKTKTGSMDDYPKGVRPLCKWSRGQCDYYDICGGTD